MAATLSLPVNGCTFYKPGWLSHFDSCAEFSAMLGRGGCTKTKGIVSYPGDHLQMWLPDFLVEVSRFFGKSMFTSGVSGTGLRLHLQAATRYANSTGMQFEGVSNGDAFDTSHSMMWHVRILPVPYGKLALNFPPLEASKGVGLPTCFAAISELDLSQWAHNLADGPVAAVLSPIAVPQCYTPLASAATAVGQTIGSNVLANSGASDGVTGQFPSGCALPIPAAVARAKSLASSDAWSASKLCIGSLGSLIPRTGLIPADNPFKAALVAGVKFASLGAEHFGDGAMGGWDLTDKWQLVYPPSPHSYCFRPGQISQALEIPFGVIEDGSTRAAEMATLSNKSSSYVFAIWRKRTSCQEPAGTITAGLAWKADYFVNKTKNIAVCNAAQVVP